MKTIYERLHIPELRDSVQISVNDIAKNANLTTKIKNWLKKRIDSMYLTAILNEDTIRIRSYKDDDYSFEVIYVFEVNLKTDEQQKDLADVLHSSFPETTILILKHRCNTYLSCAKKRINKIDKNNTVIEDSIVTKYDENAKDINIEYVNNLKEYCELFIQRLKAVEIWNITDVMPKDKNINFDYKMVIKEYYELKNDISCLDKELKNEQIIRRRCEIHERLSKKQYEMEKLKTEIRGGLNG